MFKNAGRIALIAGILVLGTAFQAFATDHDLVGTWLLKITTEGPDSVIIPTITTFHEGGTLSANSVFDFGAFGSLFGTTLGIWEEADGAFKAKSLTAQADLEGAPRSIGRTIYSFAFVDDDTITGTLLSDTVPCTVDACTDPTTDPPTGTITATFTGTRLQLDDDSSDDDDDDDDDDDKD